MVQLHSHDPDVPTLFKHMLDKSSQSKHFFLVEQVSGFYIIQGHQSGGGGKEKKSVFLI